MQTVRSSSCNARGAVIGTRVLATTGWNVVLLCLLCVMSLIIPSTWGAPSAAAASPHGPGVRAWLHSLSPNTLSPGADLHVTVTVQNTSSTNLADAQATLALGSQALDSLSAQQQWAASQSAAPSAKTTTSSVPDLAPGATANVSLTLSSSDIDASYSMTTLPISVDIQGTEGGSHASTSVHTSTPWTDTSQSFTKLDTQLVVPITLPADPSLFSSTGATRFAAWNKAIGPGSPIDKLLSANPSIPVTWLIDPTVLDPPTAQDSSLPSTATLAENGTNNPASGASPSSSTTGSSSTSSSTSPSSSTTSSSSSDPQQLTTVDDLAERLRDTLRKRPSSQQVWFTPYGDPDLSALTSSHRTKAAQTLLRRALSRQLPPSLTAISKTVVAAPPAPLDQSSEARLSADWHAARGTYPTILTPNATLSGSATSSVGSSARRTSAGRLMLGVDAAFSEPLASSSMSDAEAAAQIRSRSLAIYQQQPSTSRSVIAMSSRSTMSASRLQAISSALSSLAWIHPTALSLNSGSDAAAAVSLQSVPPSVSGVWPQPGPTALTADAIDTTAASLGNLGRYAGIVDNGSDIVPAWGRSLDQAASTRWRGHATALAMLVQSTQTTIDSIPRRVSVLPSGTINFFTDSGRITVTIRNDLARGVSGVKLHLTPRSYAIRFTQQPDGVNIDAGSRAGLRIPTTAQAAGSVDVVTRIKARNGVSLGDDPDNPVKFTINARPTGTWIYWALGIVALLIFCYGLARNRKRGTRRRDELARNIQV